MNLLPFRISRIKKETHDVHSFFLEPVVDGQPFFYQSGQFLTLVLQHAGHEVRRSYSFASAPGVDKHIYITVKRKINGEVSRHLLDHYKTGDLLYTLGASGKFLLAANTKANIFIAAGSGIIPVFSLLKQALYFHPDQQVLLINQCSTEQDVIFKEAIEELRQQFSTRLHVVQLYSRPQQYHFSRRLNNTMLEHLIGAYAKNKNTAFYICGPVTFMRMAIFTLRLLGTAESNIYKEQFVVEPPPPAPLIADTTVKNAVVHVRGQTYRYQVQYPQTLLGAALQYGIDLPYSCKAGICSTCMAHCTSGKVVMSMNEVLTEKDLNNQLILTCVGYAQTDVELSFAF